MKEKCNLIDEPWFLIRGEEPVSLRQVFTELHYPCIGGDAIDKIVFFKFLQAIAQAAATPEDEKAWQQLSSAQLAECCLAYLEKWHDRFFLFDNKPFLQMPQVITARTQHCGALLPDIATGNTTAFLHSQFEATLGNADKVRLLLRNMGFSFSGKKPDKTCVLTPGYIKRSAKTGPSVAHMGLLHSYFCGENIIDTVRLNLLTRQQIEASHQYSGGIGTPPWEQMPAGEADPIAEALKTSLMGRLVPVCRFCLFAGDAIHYTEGIQHPDHNEGFWDPTAAVNTSKAKAKALWVDVERRPWRQLPALFRFIATDHDGFDCLQLRVTLPRIKNYDGAFSLWSGGLRVSSNAGEQYVSGTDDYVDSIVELDNTMLNEFWFGRLEAEMSALEALGKKLYGCISVYYSAFKADGKAFATKGSTLFWQLCEKEFPDLLEACNASQHQEERYNVRRTFAELVRQIYDQSCPNKTARQLEAWARCRPNLAKYLKKENS